MSEENFYQRKESILDKKDKSYAGEWDKKIKKLCNKINKSKDYYTTSSCSGRMVLMKEGKVKSRDLFLFTTHEKLKKSVLSSELQKHNGNDLVKFKCEPPILHIICKNLESAEKLLKIGLREGWKNSGVINLKKNIVLELHGTEKFEFPVKSGGKDLVGEGFLDFVCEKSNLKLEKGWELIKKLEMHFS